MKITALILICTVYRAYGHGRLVHPASRASMWKYGFQTEPNFNDTELNCGGFEHQKSLGGRCGVCGDPYDSPSPRDHEAGGRYARGIITAAYKPGDIMVVRVDLDVTHDGWFEFRMCVNNDVNRAITQECLDEHLLQLADGSGTRFHLSKLCPDSYSIALRLPTGVSCSQCVLQWKYNTGNRWGMDPDGSSCTGCGFQEQFYACSDITIHRAVRTTPPYKPTQKDAAPTCVECRGVGDWAGIRANDRWCTGNCNHKPPVCPETCDCS